MAEKCWMVRAGEGGYLFDDFKEKSSIAIGWNDIGQIEKADSLESIKDRLRKIYSDKKDGYVISSANQIFKFANVFKVGDFVVTYNRITRYYLIGKITSDYIYDKELEYYHRRCVEWMAEKLRDELDPSSKNSLGSTLTIFEVTGDTLKDLLKSEVQKENALAQSGFEAEELEEIKDDVVERAHEFIKDKLVSLSWEKMQDFVAGLLRAMGYLATVSDRGPDRGKDITASPDGLGLEEPRIKVEVKHRSGAMGSPEVRSFIGSLRSEKGIYVSTGGFSKEAKYEAERSDKPITLVDLDTLVWITTQYYDKFDSEAKAILPLKKVYWPL